MGILGGIGDIFHKIDYLTSDSPEIVGKRFEVHVENLFARKFFKLVEKTHSYKTNTERYVESSKNPDFVFEYVITKEKFAVECKFRTKLNSNGQLQWSYPSQLKRYQNYAASSGIPTYIVIGLHIDDDVDARMFNIPLREAKDPVLNATILEKYERAYQRRFFWKNGKLY